MFEEGTVVEVFAVGLHGEYVDGGATTLGDAVARGTVVFHEAGLKGPQQKKRYIGPVHNSSATRRVQPHRRQPISV